MRHLGSEHERRRWPLWSIVLSVFAAAWVLHTVSGVVVVGIDKLRFTQHKLEQGFEIWLGWKTLLFVHAGSASVAIAAGASSFVLQFQRNWRWHRWLGTGYVVAVLVSAISSFPLATTATGGAASIVGFFVLGIGWLVSTGVAFQSARNKNFTKHRNWMLRSYSLSLANTTLHVVLVPLTTLVGDRTSAYQLSVWLCMIINLSVAELIALRMRNQGPK